MIWTLLNGWNLMVTLEQPLHVQNSCWHENDMPQGKVCLHGANPQATPHGMHHDGAKKDRRLVA